MTNKQIKARRSEIIRQLTNLSRNGWANALPCDYIPLEQELAALDRLNR